MPVVRIPTAFRGPTCGEGEVPVDGTDVRRCLEAVDERHPGFLALVLDAAGETHGFIKLFLNGEELVGGELQRAVTGDDRIEVLAAIAGG